MANIDLKSLGIPENELDSLIGRQRSRLVRKRLMAIRKIMSGANMKQAARYVRVRPASVSRWLRTLQRSGLAGLLIPNRRKLRTTPPIPPDQAQLARQEIAAALKRQPNWRLRLRLGAIDIALSDGPIEEACAFAHVKPTTVKDWLCMIRQGGIVEVLHAWETSKRPRMLDADAMELRELAAKATNPRLKKRFLALADLADGKGLYDAAANSGLTHTSIEKWIKRFQEGGAAAIRKDQGRPSNLSQAQLEEVRGCLREQPDMKSEELRHLIWTRFQIHYSTGARRW
jgi:transposase